MLYFSRAKTAMVIGLCLLGALLCIPNFMASPNDWLPWRRVSLGLDLRGGSYLLMQVDMAAVEKERLESLTDTVRQALRHAQLGYKNLHIDTDTHRVLMNFRTAEEKDRVLTELRNLPGTLGDISQHVSGSRFSFGTMIATQTAATEFVVDEVPGGAALTLQAPALTLRARNAVEQSIEIVRKRIDETGVIDPQITRQGDSRIIVQLPGIEDPERIKTLLGKTAKMTFRMVVEGLPPGSPAPAGADNLPMQNNPQELIPVQKQVEVDGADLTDARAGTNPQTGEWVINFTFNSTGARRFGDVTRDNVGRRFAVVLDNQVITAPVIRDAILGGRGQISGNYDAASANQLSVMLRAGALPAPLTVIEERTVGPELGADSIRAGALSLGVGFGLVIVFMALFYGLFGWFANVALIANLVLMIAILSLFEATLTLPGMAGLLLTLGMAVDANILVNERIREESRQGRTPLAAMEAGFTRAIHTIVDSNATAFLAHVMLFYFGSGPVKGFALTITIGIATSLFTSTVLARLMMVRWFGKFRPAALPV
jgi:protein-export membrane protein SecD